ncbi:hypothetical protein [Bradyrhizobium sp. Gha]|uniref:hypothetical protein n=1 Tax=Bradyrhizobium sp. Gha TaxID=1855318 RepID=UPI0008E0B7D3|nr:hypothetical protein [Bradyrhizobium sp. Gha]SFH85244.1 hypothetical protein SAMN05216525_102269 [Bradyrhizobium sp. Gha]
MFRELGPARATVASLLVRGAKRLAVRSETLEVVTGAVLVLGFGLLGSALPHLY